MLRLLHNSVYMLNTLDLLSTIISLLSRYNLLNNKYYSKLHSQPSFYYFQSRIMKTLFKLSQKTEIYTTREIMHVYTTREIMHVYTTTEICMHTQLA